MGRFLPFVTVCDFSVLATCYAEFNDRDRPRAGIVTDQIQAAIAYVKGILSGSDSRAFDRFRVV